MKGLGPVATAFVEYGKHGYAVIADVFTKYECDLIRKAAYGAIDDRYLQRTPSGRPALLFGPANLHPYLRSVAIDARLQNIVHFFLGTNVRQLNNQIYFRESGDGDEFAWHQDICFRTPREAFNNIERGYLQTIIAVDDIDENAAIEFVPGSHRDGELAGLVPRDGSEKGLRTFVRNGRQGVKVQAKAGDVLLWHVLTVHGSERNESGRARMTYMNGFARDDAILYKKDFPVYP